MGKKCGNKKKKHGQKTKEIVGKKEREIELNKETKYLQWKRKEEINQEERRT